MSELPTGTVTFLFTDIEGSTKLWERYPDAMRIALARHDDILRSAIETHGGRVFKTIGDAFCAVFPTAPPALASALTIQRALEQESWREGRGIRVRVALHTDACETRAGDYFGMPLNRVARLRSAGHGGQILLSHQTAELVRDTLPPDVTLRDLGKHRLKDLTRPENIYQLNAPDLPRSFAPLQTLDYRPNNLPISPTSLIGRERDVALVVGMYRRQACRLVTLTGPGGVGKTRLGLQVGADLLDDFPDGVFFVPLAALSDPTLVVSSIAQALDLHEEAEHPVLDTLREWFKDKQSFLILDNFEHVVEAAPTVAELLAGCSRLSVLVTSQSPLQLQGEHVYDVSPLGIPRSGPSPSVERLREFAAVRLFRERAEAARADFVVASENGPAVAEICARLEGLPLAIELAAARVRTLTPQTMLQQLDRRLPLLTGGGRDRPARHQTMRNAIAWSYVLLSESQKNLFRQLSVFVDGCTLEAVSAVCTSVIDSEMATLDALTPLVDHSLVQAVVQPDGTSRFVMLETIREYAHEALQKHAEEQLNASNDMSYVRDRHRDWFIQWVQSADGRLRTPEQSKVVIELDADQGNLRAALQWCLQTDAYLGVRLAGHLWLYWRQRGFHTEGRSWLETFLRQTSPRDHRQAGERGRALLGSGLLAADQEDHEKAHAYYDESLAIFRMIDDYAGLAHVLRAQAMRLVRTGGNVEEARRLVEESLAIAQAHLGKRDIAAAFLVLASVADVTGDPGYERELLDEALALFREVGDRWNTAITLESLAWRACVDEDSDAARQFLEEALGLVRVVGNRQSWGRISYYLAALLLWDSDQERRRTLLEDAVTFLHECGSVDAYLALKDLGELLVHQGQVQKGWRLIGAADTRLAAINVPSHPFQSKGNSEWRARLKGAQDALFVDIVKKAVAEGQMMTMQQAVAYALSDDRPDS
jgi:predicted ATPase/class 3 adenylate cyclase